MKSDLLEEERLAKSYADRVMNDNNNQDKGELGMLNSRLVGLESVVTELRQLKKVATQEARAVGAAGYDGDLQSLRKQLELLHSSAAEREELAMERERWAEEQVEVERRLFADSLRRLEAEHLSRHREATQRMVQACSRATTLVERNEAIRTTMGKAGLAAWRRRMLLAMWRAWRDMYVRNRLARIEGDYRLRLRQRVEEEVRVERQDHAEALQQVSGQAAALRVQLSEVQAAMRAEGDAAQADANGKLREARAEADTRLALAQSYLQARLFEVEIEKEKREVAERGLMRAEESIRETSEKQARASRAALDYAEERIAQVEAAKEKLSEELHILRLGDSMTSAQKEVREKEAQRMVKRAARTEAQLRDMMDQSERQWQAEKQLLLVKNEQLLEEMRLAASAAQAQLDMQISSNKSAKERSVQKAAKAAEENKALREEVTIAKLAAQIAQEHKEKEFAGMHAALKGAKQSALRKLDVRWERMLLMITWQAWKLEHTEIALSRRPKDASSSLEENPDFDFHRSVTDARTASAGSDARKPSRSISFAAEDDELPLRAFSRGSQGSGSEGSKSLFGWRRRSSADGPGSGMLMATRSPPHSDGGGNTSDDGTGGAHQLQQQGSGSDGEGGVAARSVTQASSQPERRKSSLTSLRVGGAAALVAGSLGLQRKKSLTKDGGNSSGASDGEGGDGGGGASVAMSRTRTRSGSTRSPTGQPTQAQAEYDAALAKYKSEVKEYEERLLPAYLAQQEAIAKQAAAAGSTSSSSKPPADTVAVSTLPADGKVVTTADNDADAYEYEYEYDGEDEADSKPPAAQKTATTAVSPANQKAEEDPWRMLGELEGALQP